MQLHIHHRLESPLTLPINYNHIIQAIIYSWIGRTDYGTKIHDQGYAYQKRNYKLFTFGRLSGEYAIKDKRITFYDSISFEVRSPDAFMIRNMQEGIEQKGITYGERTITNINVRCADHTVEGQALLVEMDSPVTAYITDNETQKTYYCAPNDDWFESLLQDNFYRKYVACNGVEANGEVRIMPYDVQMRDKVVTTFKGTYITAYRGKYVLAGERKYLDFMYQAGIGSKNSQGFGMFNILEEEKGGQNIL